MMRRRERAEGGERRGKDTTKMQNAFLNCENGQGKQGADKCENLKCG